MNLVQLLRKFKHPNSVHKMKGNQVCWSKNIQMRFVHEYNGIQILYRTHNNKTKISKAYEIIFYNGDPVIYVEICKYLKKSTISFNKSDIISNSLLEISTENIEESLFQSSLIYDLFEIDYNSIKLLNDIKTIYLNEEYGFTQGTTNE